MSAGGRRVGQRRGTFEAVRLANFVDCLARRTINFLGDLAPLQVGFEFTCGEIALVGVFGQIDLDQFEEPTFTHGDFVGPRPFGSQLLFQFSRRVKSLWSFAGRQMVERSCQGKQVASRFRLPDDLLWRSVAFRVDTGLGGHARSLGSAHVTRRAEVDEFDGASII